MLTASASDSDPPARPSARSRTSSTVGCAASAISFERRYSCNDMCRARALPQHRGPLATWTAWVAPKTLKPAEAARLVGLYRRLAPLPVGCGNGQAAPAGL